MLRFYISLICFLFPVIISAQNKLQLPGCIDSSNEINTAVWNLSIADFISGVADKKPVAGGGFVCAVAGTEALSLVIMTLELSESKQKSDSDRLNLLNLIKSLRKKTEVFSCVAVKDKQAYQKLLSAFKLPKSTTEEKLFRDSMIYLASLEATEVPLAAVDKIAELFPIIQNAIPFVSKSLSTDIGAAAYILNATAKAFLLFAKANMENFLVPDKERFQKRAVILDKIIYNNIQVVINSVSENIKP
jgi:methenyltetrahydrofolate cyclohydrolase